MHTLLTRSTTDTVCASPIIMQTTLYWFTAILYAIASHIDSGDRTQWNRSNHHKIERCAHPGSMRLSNFLLWPIDLGCESPIFNFHWFLLTQRAWDEMRWDEITKSPREPPNGRTNEIKKRKCSLSVVALIRKMINDSPFVFVCRRICMQNCCNSFVAPLEVQRASWRGVFLYLQYNRAASGTDQRVRVCTETYNSSSRPIIH